MIASYHLLLIRAFLKMQACFELNGNFRFSVSVYDLYLLTQAALLWRLTGNGTFKASFSVFFSQKIRNNHELPALVGL